MLELLKFIALLVSVGAAGFFSLTKNERGRFNGINIKRAIGGVLGVVIVGILLSSFGTLGAGERGVVKRMGAVTGRVLDPGLYMVTPWIEEVHAMDVRTQKEDVDAQAASKDLQNVTTKVAVNYALNPNRVADVYRELGDDYRERILDPAVQEAIKATTAHFNAEALIAERHTVKEALMKELSARLTSKGMILDAVSMTDFKFEAEFVKAVEAKVTATQLSLKAENDLKRVKFEADQRVAQATGEAEAIRIQAQAIQSQGGKEYVAMKAIEKWDGALPVNMYGSAPVPFINVPSGK